MKILYVASNQKTAQFPFLTDYQNDCLLIGLKELFGDDVVDVNKRFHLYSDYPEADAKADYGSGFTITRYLESDNCDREDIHKKIKNNYFDLVIYGSIWRNQDYIDLVHEHYDKSKILYIDGEDSTNFNERLKDGALYFKRELNPDPSQNLGDLLRFVLPIQFAFPTKKFNKGMKKERRVAHSDPRDRSTYVFKTEGEYYQDYQFSKYAVTTKKAGWDCLRHYEIMGNSCIPLFQDIQHAPRFTMMKLPKALLTKVMFFDKNDPKWLDKNYDYLLSEMQEHFEKYNTTVRLAEQVLNEVKIYKRS
jgi:hypothetical protein